MPFSKALTGPANFTIPGTPVFKVPMMRGVFHDIGYMEAADFQLAQFMYKNKEVSMVVILPIKTDGLPEVEKKLSAEVLEQALTKLRRTALYVQIPKFKLTEEFDLGRELSKLGMNDAFRQGIADFTGMQTNSLKPLFISTVAHRAFVDIDEEGAEAAAATMFWGTVWGTAKRPSPPIWFHADHPFLFIVRHNGTGSILFMGRVSDPRGN